MNVDQMINRLYTHPIMQEVGMEMALGFPFFTIQKGTLHVHFFLHQEHVSADCVTFFKPAYRLEFVFPFRHLCRFDNFVLEGLPDAGTLVKSQFGTQFQQQYHRLTCDIRLHVNRVLVEASLLGTPRADTIAQCNQAVLDAIATLALSDIYPSEAM